MRGSLEAESEYGICEAAWDHDWLSLSLLSETLKMNSHFSKTRHFSLSLTFVSGFFFNVYACLTLGYLFLQFGSASLLRVFLFVCLGFLKRILCSQSIPV